MLRGEIRKDITQEQFNTAIKLHHRLEALAKVKEEIANTKEHRLWYAKKRSSSYSSDDWSLVGEYKMRDISDILDRHDQMIRQEIDEEIAKITKQIEEL